MTAPARLTALRLVGFKSFAERTTIEFGPGISAIVGPNGSGKSNLADALRWTLGETGRSLRTRRAEDVIFAGSSVRRAIGMADVTLVIDNADRLLPVDYGEVELGRRLYRSGENEYLLNRQRVRFRDLIELLDAGNLADNAFLFIGQGMVDQALALRPEERRPLFEEAAGVRRHERRRRHAEAELAEAESNLERLRDLLGELRPQARRLAAQAEQLQARQTAGLELARALVGAARSRWAEAAATASRAGTDLAAAHAETDSAMAALRGAEEEAEALSRGLAERAERETGRRTELDRLRVRTLELRLARERRLSDVEAVTRDRQRLNDERAAMTGRAAEARAVLARPRPVDGGGEAELATLDRQITDLRDELRVAAAGEAGADAFAARRRSELATRAAGAEQARARVTALAERRERSKSAVAAAEGRAAGATRERDEAVAALAAAAEAERAEETRADDARRALDAAAARHAERARVVADLGARAAALAARLEVLDAAITGAVDAGLLRAARARGGGLVAEGLEVEPRLSRAVAAALGEAARAVAVEEAAVVALSGSHGVLVTIDGESSSAGRQPVAGRGRGRTAAADADRTHGLAAARGGGLLRDALRRDPAGHVGRLLSRTAWAPDIAAALALRPELPAGWSVATPAGELVSDLGVVRLGGDGSFLDQRSQREEVAREVERAQAALETAAAEAAEADAERRRTADAADATRRDLDARRRAHRVAQEAERAAQRRAEQRLRDQGWEAAQLSRAESDVADAQVALAEAEAALAELEPAGAGGHDERSADVPARLGERLEALLMRRARLAEAEAARNAELTAWFEERRRAEVTLALDESRAADLDAEAQRLAAREAEVAAELDGIAGELASAEDAEGRVQAELATLVSGGSDERARLQAVERAALTARERLRAADARSRAVEVAAMEARLHLEGIREQLLVELAGIGADGLAALVRTQPSTAHDVGDAVDVAGTGGDDPAMDALGSDLEAALAAVLPTWETVTDPEPAPSPARLAALRRRFHDLGASNPFAVEEHAEVSDRLAGLEAQRDDLETAIRSTRELIGDLTTLITDQFRHTFAALEDAFARRFRQLFDGGEAELSLTAPEDLSATGVEITARPPGKKRQPLAMLSGGERALTAVALLLAMLEVRPVPFCVLDEVDAALDEANIARFSTALRGLADRIQFVVITHNRGTIEAADALYGVTIGEDAVSRIVSLRLPAAPPTEETTSRLAAASTT